jgi:uncharacterized protein YgiM (DUF1202 family)
MKRIGKRLMSLGLSAVLSATIFVSMGVQAFAYTETTGTVATSNVKVRSEASTTASQISSLREGDTVEIIDEATDASGYVWYKIRVNKSEKGYVRSDLIKKSGDSSAKAETTTTTTTNTTESNAAAASLPATTVTATESRPATITQDSVNVREGAGTAYNSVGKVTKGDTVTITGEATGSDNKTWYQVTFGSSNKTGFIRSDLLEVGEAAPAENTEAPEGGETPEAVEGEGENTEAPEEGQSEESSQPASAGDAGDGHYSLVYLEDGENGAVWYLYDNVEGYRVKVNELIDAAKSSDEVSKLVKSNNNYKTILIILAVVIAALVVGLILLALKLRDSLYYEDDEDEEYDRYSQPSRRRARDDDDEDEEEHRPARRQAAEERTVRPSRDENARPVRARREENSEERPARPRRSAEYDEERQERQPRRNPEDRPARRPARDDSEERPVRRPSRSEAEQPRREEAPRRKTKNFIGDEDDFEFEFLDLDDEK